MSNQYEPDETITQELYEQSLQTFERGTLVKGKVLKVDPEGVLVDVGGKTDGFIPPEEMSKSSGHEHDKEFQVGEEIDVVVLDEGNEDQGMVLSKKKADLEKAFRRLKNAFETGEVVHATVIERVKGGVVVDLGVRGFIPGSHVGKRPVKNLEDFLGESLPLKVIEIDSTRRKVVLSHRQALEEAEKQTKGTFWSKAKEGQVWKGKIARLTNFGAFVDLGGIDGLIHLSELSWSRVKHPSEVVNIGQEVEVFILRLDPEKGKVSLSLRSTQGDPWENLPANCKEGAVVKGQVSRIAKNYVFVEVVPGIEGLIPIAELDNKKVANPSEIVKEGEEIKVKIVEVKANERRMTLSRKQALAEQENKEVSGYLEKQEMPPVTIGELVGKSLQRSLAPEESSLSCKD